MEEDPSVAERSGPVNGHPVDGVPQGAVPSKRCRATNRRGEQCGRWAIVGGTVCTTHGGGAPQVREAARQRILELVPLAVRTLSSIAKDPEAPAAARVRAAVEILDRGVGKALEEVRVLGADDESNQELDARIAAALDVRSQLTGTKVLEPGPEVPEDRRDVLLPATILVPVAPSHTAPHT